MKTLDQIKKEMLAKAYLLYPEGSIVMNAYSKYDPSDVESHHIFQNRGLLYVYEHSTYPKGVFAIKSKHGTGLVYIGGYWADIYEVEGTSNFVLSKVILSEIEIELELARKVIYDK